MVVFTSGFAEDEEHAIPWYISKSKLYNVVYTKANAAALRKVVVWHETRVTFAKQFPMSADHAIEPTYHHYLPTQDSTPSHAEVGIDGVRFLEQLMGIAFFIFKNTREMIHCFLCEIKRWKGDHLFFRNVFVQH